MSIFCNEVLQAKKKYAAVAPTGRQSSALNCQTTFGFLGLYRIDISPRAMVDQHASVSVKEQIREVDFLVVDEAGMIGARFFNMMSQRLQAIRNSSLPFGGLSIILSIDGEQTSPVMDFSLLKNPRECECEYAKAGIALFRSATSLIQLQKSYRQQGDERFEAILDRIRARSCIKEDLTILSTRLYDNLSKEQKKTFDKVPRLFGTNDQVFLYAEEKVNEQYENARLYEPILTPHCAICAKDYKKFYFAPNVEVMLTRNLLYEKKLYNGLVVSCIQAVHTTDQALPDYIILRSREFRGNFLPGTTDHFSIGPIRETRLCKHRNIKIKVTFYPLAPGCAFTIHKVRFCRKFKIIHNSRVKFSLLFDRCKDRH